MDYIKKLENNIKYVYLYNFCHSLIFAYVIERLFWRSRGISVIETVYLEAIYAVFLIVLEVPSGMWADMWRRKDMIVLGQVLSMLEMLILVFAHNFFAFAIVMVVAASSGAVRSGSSNALIYDSLKGLKREKEFEKVIGRVKAFDFTSHMIAALAGGYIASQGGLLINYQLSVVSCCFAILFSLLLTEPKKVLLSVEENEVRARNSETDKANSKTDKANSKTDKANSKTVKEETNKESGKPYCEGEKKSRSLRKYKVFLETTIKSTRSILREKEFLKYVMVVGIVVGANINYMWEFWQNYSEAIGIEVVYFGIVSALCSFGVMISASKTYTVLLVTKDRAISKKYLYQLSMVVIGLCFIGMYFVRNVYSIGFLVVVNLFAGFFETMSEGDIHHSIESESRATVESIYSMLLSVSTILVGVVFGFVTDYFDIFSGFGILGVIILGVLIFAPRPKENVY